MTLIMAMAIGIILAITLVIAFSVFSDLILRITARRHDSRFEPTRRHVVEAAVDALTIQPSDIVYDLGCGDGRFIFHAYAKEPRATYIGIEYGRTLYLLLLVRKFLRGNPSNLILRRENLMKTNLSDATKMYLFHLPTIMAVLLPKCTAELRQARVAAWCSPFAGIPAQRTIDLLYEGTSVRTLYLYDFPAA
jgi:hypothetical protein